jgi:hypothetical protein
MSVDVGTRGFDGVVVADAARMNGGGAGAVQGRSWQRWYVVQQIFKLLGVSLLPFILPLLLLLFVFFG